MPFEVHQLSMTKPRRSFNVPADKGYNHRMREYLKGLQMASIKAVGCIESINNQKLY